MALIKKIVKVGNGAGVILPKAWYGGKAKVELVKDPINIEKDIFKILRPYLKNVLGIYLTGSYAREEQTDESDVDVLVISDKLNKKIKVGKYDLIIMSEMKLRELIEENVIPLLPMIKESRALINESLKNKYAGIDLNEKNLKWYLENTRSSLDILEGLLNLSEDEVVTSLGYSIILNLRSTYIVDCLIREKDWNNRELREIIRKITGSLRVYEIYSKVKNNESINEGIKSADSIKLVKYIREKLKEHEKWVKRKK